jgi:hypothetical protein
MYTLTATKNMCALYLHQCRSQHLSQLVSWYGRAVGSEWVMRWRGGAATGEAAVARSSPFLFAAPYPSLVIPKSQSIQQSSQWHNRTQCDSCFRWQSIMLGCQSYLPLLQIMRSNLLCFSRERPSAS